MKRIMFVLLAALIFNCSNGQDMKSMLCGKKWYPIRIKDVDGRIDKLDGATAQLYSLLNCDGTFESWEDTEVLVKGKWRYESKSNTVILVSTNLKSNVTTKLKVINCNGKSFDYITKDGGGESITIYSISK